MECTILLRDVDRVIYKVGDLVHKKRLFGLSYEYIVGNYINSLNNKHCVKTVEYIKGKLTTEYIDGSTWHSFLKTSDKYEQIYDINREVLEAVEFLPFTHYDLHMNNVIKTTNGIKIIDFGLSAIPSSEWKGETYSEGGLSSLSCGMIPSIIDPDFDKMLIILSLYKQAKKFNKGELERWCMEKITSARFNNPHFFGYEHLFSVEYLQNFDGILYNDRLPLINVTEEINKSTLEDRIRSVNRKDINEIYKIFYSYKKYRINNRKTPTFKEIKDYI